MSFILGMLSGFMLGLVVFGYYCYSIYKNKHRYNLDVEIGILNKHTEILKRLMAEQYKYREDVN